MQKIINVLSVASFVISASVVGAGIFVYANKDSLIESAKEKIMGQVGAIAGDKIKEMVPTPSLPDITGPVVPRSTRSGLGVPQF
tara:strand:+ start:3659 stop:3910 length:252 start_codon:yes stop_codon:yes gene_type:complete